MREAFQLPGRRILGHAMELNRMAGMKSAKPIRTEAAPVLPQGGPRQKGWK